MHESIADTLITRLQEAFKAIAAGLGADPQEPTTTYGPVVDKGQYEKVLAYISEGKKSAEIISGDVTTRDKGILHYTHYLQARRPGLKDLQGRDFWSSAVR